MKIQSRVTIYADPRDHQQLLRSVRALIESARHDSACIDGRLYADAADPHALTLVEVWATRHDLERRVRSPDYGRLLQLVELSRRPPEIEFHTITETVGLEAVQKIRLGNDQDPVRGNGQF